MATTMPPKDQHSFGAESKCIKPSTREPSETNATLRAQEDRCDQIALYAGSFDPLTLGHMDVINVASGLFSRVIVALGSNPRKQFLLSADTRRSLVESACADLNVEVVIIEGLVAVYASNRGVQALIRGLRSEADFVSEMQMAHMNSELAPSIPTVFVPTKATHSHISSTLVKEVAQMGGSVSQLVPPGVEEALLAELAVLKKP